MEVQACGSIAKVVLHIDDNAISHAGGNPGNRPLAIDAHDRASLQTIRVGRDPGDIEVVRDCGSVGEHAKAQERDDTRREHVVLSQDLIRWRSFDLIILPSTLAQGLLATILHSPSNEKDGRERVVTRDRPRGKQQVCAKLAEFPRVKQKWVKAGF